MALTRSLARGTGSRKRGRSRLRPHLSLAAHPEALPLSLSALAWAVLILGRQGSSAWGLLCTTARPAAGLADAAKLAGHELTMLAAMMLPLVLFQVRHVVTRSYAERQLRGALGFLAGYLAPWLAAALPIAALALVAGGMLPVAAQRGLTLPLFGVAALWQLSRRKTELLRQCARTVPLRQDGWRADAACLAYGAETARDCMANCWAPMLAALFRPHDLMTMAIVQIVATSERATPAPYPRLAAVALTVAGVIAALA